jgi:hypothetical protein
MSAGTDRPTEARVAASVAAPTVTAIRPPISNLRRATALSD